VAGPDLPAAALERIAALAAAEPGREVCGLLLLGAEGRFEVWPCRNASPRPEREFELHPVDLLRALERADAARLEVAAAYHSHPHGRATLSPRDLSGALEGGLPLLPGAAVLVAAPGPDGAPRVVRHRLEAGAFSDGEVIFGGRTAR
jgi:proteasome lid subunit RPN8/RPN11